MVTSLVRVQFSMSEQKSMDANHLPECPVEVTLSLLSNKWKVVILRDLFDGPRRFNELKASIGTISAKVLTTNLRAMEADGLLTRTVYAEVPPRVEYELTGLGHSLQPVIGAMKTWGASYKGNRTHEASRS